VVLVERPVVGVQLVLIQFFQQLLLMVVVAGLSVMVALEIQVDLVVAG
jgi:hypothetical protein